METMPAAWPEPLTPKALCGLAGEVVKTIEPHSEADPAALLVQLLAVFGSVIGRGPHFRAEDDRHYTNLFCCLVGRTAGGRKGVSFNRVRSLFEGVDSTWVKDRIGKGLSTGEGLIHAVRDPNGKDPGVDDKRLLAYQPEFARLLKVSGRQGNILSTVIREAWDSGDLEIKTKTNPSKATGAHISIVGHITRDELTRYVDIAEATSGFLNRFLWVCTQRSKLLPHGGKLPTKDGEKLVKLISEAVDFASQVGEIRRTREANGLWERAYPKLTKEKSGIVGGVLARSDPQVMRLACVYALMDKKKAVTSAHLRAAGALWWYCNQSARYVFAEAASNDPRVRILESLKARHPKHMTATEISALFNGHMPSDKLQGYLSELRRAHKAKQETIKTKGRSEHRWYFVKNLGSDKQE